MTTEPQFMMIGLSGEDSIKFLQGQLTCNVNKLAQLNQSKQKMSSKERSTELSSDLPHYQATAISNLKGRIQFGIWIAQLAEKQFTIVVCSDCADELLAHIKKFGAFSKISITEPQPIFPIVQNGMPTFGNEEAFADVEGWTKSSIAQGNYWITHAMQDVYQPQEMRLHQRGGVDYDKGCYLGQEVIARIYFKSSPKSYLHRIAGTGDCPQANDKIGEKARVQVVNAITVADNCFEALVIARPDLLAEFEVLPLPQAMMGGVSRKESKSENL